MLASTILFWYIQCLQPSNQWPRRIQRCQLPAANLIGTAIGLVVALVSPSIADVVEIKSFGHSSFLVRGGGHSILLNPFKAVGCAQGLKEPNVIPDIVLASSELADEGYWKKKGVFFVKCKYFQFILAFALVFLEI